VSNFYFISGHHPPFFLPAFKFFGISSFI